MKSKFVHIIQILSKVGINEMQLKKTHPFLVDGNMFGFGGSQLNGRKEMETVNSPIFTDHQTGPYAKQ
jgi:hypothetical protein